MLNDAVSKLFSDGGAGLRARIIGIYVLLIAANVAVWLWALLAFRNYPILLGITIVVAVATVVGSLLADIAYAVLDPRVRYVSQ